MQSWISSFFPPEVFLSAVELVISSASSLKVLLKEFRKSCCFPPSPPCVCIFWAWGRGWGSGWFTLQPKKISHPSPWILLAAKRSEDVFLLVIGFIFAIQNAKKNCCWWQCTQNKVCRFSTNDGKSHYRPVVSVQSVSGSIGGSPTACCVRASQEEVQDWALKAGGVSGSDG